MKIAVPVAVWEGWLSPVSDHFGHAPYFAVVDTTTRSIRSLESRKTRQPSECAPISAIKSEGCEAVVCRHLGRGALARCHARGLKVYAAEGETLEEVRDAFTSGSEVELSDDALCQGGGHHDHDRGQHDHGHCGHSSELESDGPIIVVPDPSIT